MQFDRFDICSAYYLFGFEYNKGQWSKEFAYMSRAYRAGFKPGFSFDFGSLTDNGKAIYNNLVKRLESNAWNVNGKFVA